MAILLVLGVGLLGALLVLVRMFLTRRVWAAMSVLLALVLAWLAVGGRWVHSLPDLMLIATLVGIAGLTVQRRWQVLCLVAVVPLAYGAEAGSLALDMHSKVAWLHTPVAVVSQLGQILAPLWVALAAVFVTGALGRLTGQSL